MQARARATEALRRDPSSPTKVRTLRLWSGSECRFRTLMPGVSRTEAAMREIFAVSRPSLKLGTASKSLGNSVPYYEDAADQDQYDPEHPRQAELRPSPEETHSIQQKADQKLGGDHQRRSEEHTSELQSR